MKHNKPPVLLLALLLLSFILAACSQETDLFLRSQERWELKSVSSLNLAMLPSIGGEIEGFNLNFDTGELSTTALEFTYGQLVSYFEGRGMEASWQKTAGKAKDETAYRFNVSGQGWHLLSQLASPDPALLKLLEGPGAQVWPFGMAVVEMDNGQLQFTMDIPEGTAALGAVFPVTFRLHGGEVISSNANFVEGGVATWLNPQGRVESVVTPATFLSAGATIVLIILGILIVGGVLVFVVVSSSRPSSRLGQRSRPSIPRPPARNPRRPVRR